MQTEINSELLKELRLRANEQGRPERELLDEAVRSYLERPGSLVRLLESVDRGQDQRGVEAPPEDEAMRLAVEEQHSWRRENRSAG